MREETSDARVVGVFCGDDGICAVGRGHVELGIFGECALAFLSMSVDVFPGLWSAVDELVGCNPDDVAVFVVEI